MEQLNIERDLKRVDWLGGKGQANKLMGEQGERERARRTRRVVGNLGWKDIYRVQVGSNFSRS